MRVIGPHRVEIAVAYPLLGIALRPRRPRLAAIVIANLVTHPIVYTLAATLTPSLLVVPLCSRSGRRRLKCSLTSGASGARACGAWCGL